MDEAGEFYFMEMNTRIQVEHPITEMVTNIDLVKNKLRLLAANRWISNKKMSKCKVLPSSVVSMRKIQPLILLLPLENSQFVLPGGGLGVRVDSAMYSGYTIPPYYDSMIAKVIVHGENRFEALMKMQRALAELVTEG